MNCDYGRCWLLLALLQSIPEDVTHYCNVAAKIARMP